MIIILIKYKESVSYTHLKAGSHVKQYTFDGRYQVRFNSEELLSLEQTYMDYLGGAHPNTYLDTINVNLKNGKLLSLGDMFRCV